MSTLTIFLLILLILPTTLSLITIALAQAVHDLTHSLASAKSKIKDLEVLLASTQSPQPNLNLPTVALFLAILALAAYHVLKSKRTAHFAEAQVHEMTAAIEKLQKEIQEAQEELSFMTMAVRALQDGVDAGREDGEEHEEDKEWRIIRSLLEEDEEEE